jgi:hypothetical protein
MPELTQEQRIHQVLLEARGSWVSGRYFLHQMMLSQYHRAIHTLEKKLKAQGVEIEHSKFTDEWGFKSYRIVQKDTQLAFV